MHNDCEFIFMFMLTLLLRCLHLLLMMVMLLISFFLEWNFSRTRRSRSVCHNFLRGAWRFTSMFLLLVFVIFVCLFMLIDIVVNVVNIVTFILCSTLVAVGFLLLFFMGNTVGLLLLFLVIVNVVNFLNFIAVLILMLLICHFAYIFAVTYRQWNMFNVVSDVNVELCTKCSRKKVPQNLQYYSSPPWFAIERYDWPSESGQQIAADCCSPLLHAVTGPREGRV